MDSYEFYKTHREQLISYLSEIHSTTVCCNILESQLYEAANSSSENLQFKNAMFKPPAFKLTNFIHDLMVSFKLIKKIDPDITFFISPKYHDLIFSGLAIEILILSKDLTPKF